MYDVWKAFLEFFQSVTPFLAIFFAILSILAGMKTIFAIPERILTPDSESISPLLKTSLTVFSILKVV